MKRWGIALGAGGVFGFAHIGVIEALEAKGLQPVCIAGTSAGAIVGGLWAAGIKITEIKGELEALALGEGAETFPRYLRLPKDHVPAAAVQGLVGTDWLESFLNRLLGNKSISAVEIPLSIVSCDLRTGDTVVFTNRMPRGNTQARVCDPHRLSKRRYITGVPLATAMVASSALPGVFVPKRLWDLKLVDGGIKEMVPAYEVRRLGAQEVLAVDLGSHAERPREVKGIYSVLSRSLSVAARPVTLEHLKLYSSLTLRPPVRQEGLLTPSRIRALIEAGRRCAEQHMPEWLSIIGRQETG